MKKVTSIILVVVIFATGLFVLTGCDFGKNSVEIFKTMGKVKVTLSVPKKEDGTPKYEFTDEKPEQATIGDFYLMTDKTVFTFSTSGLVYNTASNFKEKNGDKPASFDGYLDWINDSDSKINLSGMEKLDLNGRKALRYHNRTGSYGKYTYDGFFYMVAADNIIPGSYISMTVNYKEEEKPTESKEFDEETLYIIKSAKFAINE